jgi:molybdenum cofactor biosynthesis enzyme MoaA
MSATLTDSFGRRIEHARLFVTGKCTLYCFYCLPRHARGFANRKNQLHFDAHDTERSR